MDIDEYNGINIMISNQETIKIGLDILKNESNYLRYIKFHIEHQLEVLSLNEYEVTIQKLPNVVLIRYKTERKTHPSERGWDVSDKR